MKKTIALIAALVVAGVQANADWTVSNALDVAADLDKVDSFDVYTEATGEPGTLTLIEDPTGTLKNLDGTPAIVVEALGSQTVGARFVQSYNFPAPAPTDSVYTVYWRWMYPTGGAPSHQELAPLAGEDEVLFEGAVLQANGPWFHNWVDLAFCYNGAGSWVCGPDIGQFLGDTWYEYWLVVDPANVSYDWLIRGGDFTDITPIFEDALFANLDTTDPLKALQEYHWMGQGGLFGPQYYDAMHIDTAGENLTTPEGLGSITGSTWTEMNALDVAADLDKVDSFDVYTEATGEPGTLTLIEDPTGTLKNLDGTPAIVVEALGSQTVGARFVQSYNFPAPAPTDSVYTVYWRWMYPTGGAPSHQELAPLAGEDEVLFEGAVLQANGPWFHNWVDLAFCYNGAGSWVCGPDIGQFLGDTWYEYWLVVDPANVSYDWLIRGGDFTDITPIFEDALFANLDTTDPLKALQEYHWMGQGGLFGPQYYDAMFIDTTGENMTSPPALGSIFGEAGENDPLIGGTPLGDGWFWSDWLGAYNTAFAPWIFHAQHAWLYRDVSSTNAATYFYDDAMVAWWYTDETNYPSVYAFDPPADLGGTDIDSAWLWFFEDANGPRWFSVLSGPSTGSFLSFNP